MYEQEERIARSLLPFLRGSFGTHNNMLFHAASFSVLEIHFTINEIGEHVKTHLTRNCSFLVPPNLLEVRSATRFKKHNAKKPDHSLVFSEIRLQLLVTCKPFSTNECGMQDEKTF